MNSGLILISKVLLAAFTTVGFSSCTSVGTTDLNESISRTEAMAGKAEAPEGVQTDTSTRQIDYNAMFADVGNTAAYSLAALTKMDPNLSTFAVMVERADLHHALANEETLTLFAPSNQAFADWPQDSLNNLMQPEHKAQLIKLLQAHMLLKEASSSSLSSSQSMETSGGEFVAISTEDRSVTVGGATIVRPDIVASNGILHVVDRVLSTADDIIVDQ